MFKKSYFILLDTVFALIFISSPSFNANANTLTMELHGYIKDRCEINFSSGDVMHFSDKTEQSLPFNLYCNRPLGLSISSKNGGLKHQQKGSDIIERYNLTLQIDDLKINAIRNSSQLIIPSIIEKSSGVIPFSQRGLLRVALENRLLYAGYYQDVIEIEVYPSIHNVTQ